MSRNNRTKNESLEQMLLKLSEKVDLQYSDLDKRLDNIEKVMIAQEINLKDHMRRSDNLEILVSDLKEKEVKPIQRHVYMVEGVLKFLGVAALLVGLISGLLGLIKLI